MKDFFIVILIILQYLFLFGILAILGYISYIMISFKDLVPYVPTPRKCIKKMIKHANIKKNEKVCDLGSGTGRILTYAAKRHKHNIFVGIEKSFLLRFVTRLKLIFLPHISKRIQIINKDFFNINLYNYDVVFCFLTPEALRLLNSKFKMLKRGSRIISYMFPIEDYQGFDHEIDHISSKDSIYIYKKL